MARKKREVVEQADAGREGCWKSDRDGVGVERGHLQLFSARLQRIGQRAAAPLVVRRLEGKQHIVGGEGMAV